jgi:hypothetical protein
MPLILIFTLVDSKQRVASRKTLQTGGPLNTSGTLEMGEWNPIKSHQFSADFAYPKTER